MTGAMYAAIGGLKSHMSKLNVIGNNIANVNTYAYKAGRMTFKESMYTTSRSGSNGGATSGGNNPSQIGYGCSVGSVDLNMAPSTYAPTGIGLDCMLDGEGFFLVGDKDGNILSNSDVKQLNLSRWGSFWQDPDGYICDRYGQVVYGFATVQNPDYNPNATKPEALGENPTPEEKKEYEENMAAYTLSQQKTIVSTQLVPLRLPLSAAEPTKENGGIIEVTTGTGADQTTTESAQWEVGEPVYPYMKETVVDGKTYWTNEYTADTDKATVPDPDDADPDDPQKGSLGLGNSMAVPGQNTDVNRVSNELFCQLKKLGVEKNGAITGIAANGDTVVIGYVAVANVDSSDGVTHVDGPYYKAMGGAGAVRVSALGGVLEGKYLGNQVVTAADPNDPDAVAQTPDPADAIVNEKDVEVRNGGLEASSTDVATEFSEMITTQRGYQANTRIITVTDSMLEELVNMKR